MITLKFVPAFLLTISVFFPLSYGWAFPQSITNYTDSAESKPSIVADNCTSTIKLHRRIVEEQAGLLPNFTTINNVFDAANRLNVSAVAIARFGPKFAEVCKIFVGEEGNPDLSGIGAMYSFHIQIIFVIFNGLPVVCACIISRLRRYVLMRLVSFWRICYETACWFSLCVIVACTIYGTNDKSDYELNFIQELAGFQNIMTLTISFFMLETIELAMDLTDFEDIRLRLVTVISLIVGIAEQIRLLPGIGLVKKWNSDEKTAIEQVAKYCGYPNKVKEADPETCGPPKQGKGDFFRYTYLSITIFYSILLMVSCKRGKFQQTIGFFLYMGLTFAGVLQFVALVDQRSKLRGVVGEAFEDDEWGLGQLLSVLAWAPLAWEFIKLLACILQVYLSKMITKINGRLRQSSHPYRIADTPLTATPDLSGETSLVELNRGV